MDNPVHNVHKSGNPEHGVNRKCCIVPCVDIWQRVDWQPKRGEDKKDETGRSRTGIRFIDGEIRGIENLENVTGIKKFHLR